MTDPTALSSSDSFTPKLARPLRTYDDPVLGIAGFAFRDLFEPAKLTELTDRFHSFARDRAAPEAWQKFDRYRTTLGEGMSPEEISEAIVVIAPLLGSFVSTLFQIDEDRTRLFEIAERERVVFTFKREFVKKRSAKRKKADVEGWPTDARALLDETARELLRVVTGAPDVDTNDEREVAQAVMNIVERDDLFRKAIAKGGGADTTATDREDAARLARKFADSRPLATLVEGIDALHRDPSTSSLDDANASKVYAAALDVLDRWCALRTHDRGYEAHWVSLRTPHTLDFQHLVHLRRPDERVPEMFVSPEGKLRTRDGFVLTDRRMGVREVFNEIDYCIYCHDRNKDSCSKGIRDKATGAFKANALGISMPGCPLEEKISEAHYLKSAGATLSALAVVMIDNPTCPGTGHRICNDCMKACIYQKQEPVNIPQIETSILTDVLHCRWGVEIYDLLTRWNPLNVKRPHRLSYNGKNVLVVGLGPAGYTLAHHLLNEGFGVVGIDGLKIEPLPNELMRRPIERWADWYEELDERITLGLGGVSEYGITVRWDKNFLNLVYLSLARRDTFRVYGGVRFGGTLDIDDAWRLGFHHVAIAAGAGKPTLIDMPNGLARGIRQASDFLMALQLTGAYKRSSLAVLSVRLPAVVIGGGLTGIDTATELRAYYPLQCEKMLARYEHVIAERGEAAVLAGFDAEEREQLSEALDHGRAIRLERECATREGREPDFNALIDAWGGVTLAYRRTINDSPAYRLNHEEVEKFLEEGVRFVERVSPKEAKIDSYGAVRAVVFDRMMMKDGKLVATGETLELPAKTVCIAAGTSPNVTYERELPSTFEMDPKTKAFRPYRADVGDDGHVKLTPDPDGFFTSYLHDDHTVTYYGDNLPTYAGSVVKALGSAKDGFPHVVRVFAREIANLDPAGQPARDAAWRKLTATLDDQLRATVVRVDRLTPTIVEVIVRAPLAAKKFHPGQFYRLQNFEMFAPVVEGTRLAMEGLALTGASTDPASGQLSMIVLEMGGSSRLCAALRPGEPVVVMGPTGAPTEIPRGETVMLAGGGLGNAVLFSIGKALRAAGCKVIYFAGYRLPEDVYKRDDLEASADQIVWSVDKGTPPAPRRPQDRAFVGNIVQAMVAFARGELGESSVDLKQCGRVIAIGSDRMMNAVREARHGALLPYLKPRNIGIASVNSPMQCMMKEICAQCLQRLVDPVTGKSVVVFTCFNQDQDMDQVDFSFLASRLRAASMQEKVANLWLGHLLAKQNVLRV